jgi:hypothetical protein
MPSSGMLRHVAFVRTDVAGERNTSIIRVTRIGELDEALNKMLKRGLFWYYVVTRTSIF